MIIGNKEYLTPEEIDNVYASNAKGVDIQSKINKYTPSDIIPTNSFVVVNDVGIPQEIRNRPEWFNNDGTPVTDEFLNSENFYNYFNKIQPSFDPYTEIIEECTLQEYNIDHQKKTVIQEWKKRSLTEKEQKEYIKMRWQEIRNLRNKLLLESDWTQANDQPIKIKSKWTQYREDLRNIPNKFNDPREVIFPKKPV
ncbi:hypothetical protein EB001_01005 [bacterium]|nr:hypothetical protein [bacterium]